MTGQGVVETTVCLAFTKHLASKATALRSINQHLAFVEAKAFLAETDQAVSPEESQGTAIKQKLSTAFASTQFLTAMCCLLNLSWFFINEHLLAVNDPPDRGGLKWTVFIRLRNAVHRVKNASIRERP